jgi:hypothetical protein
VLALPLRADAEHDHLGQTILAPGTCSARRSAVSTAYSSNALGTHLDRRVVESATGELEVLVRIRDPLDGYENLHCAGRALSACDGPRPCASFRQPLATPSSARILVPWPSSLLPPAARPAPLPTPRRPSTAGAARPGRSLGAGRGQEGRGDRRAREPSGRSSPKGDALSRGARASTLSKLSECPAHDVLPGHQHRAQRVRQAPQPSRSSLPRRPELPRLARSPPSSSPIALARGRASTSAGQGTTCRWWIEAALHAPRDSDVDGPAGLRGNERAPVTVVVFADFQCPHCRAEAPVLRQGGRSVPRARASLDLQALPAGGPRPRQGRPPSPPKAAHEQGKFWEMHDHRVRQPGAISSDDEPHASYAVSRSDSTWSGSRPRTARPARARSLGSRRTRPTARRSQLQGTPAVFVDGREVITQGLFGGTVTGLDRRRAQALGEREEGRDAR